MRSNQDLQDYKIDRISLTLAFGSGYPDPRAVTSRILYRELRHMRSGVLGVIDALVVVVDDSAWAIAASSGMDDGSRQAPALFAPSAAMGQPRPARWPAWARAAP